MFMVIFVVVIVVPVMYITFFASIIHSLVTKPKTNDNNKHTSSDIQVKTEEEEGLEQYGEFFDEHYFWP